MTIRPRVVFFGTPPFALPFLQVLLAESEVVAVVTQPDRAAGRGQSVVAPPAKTLAISHKIPVWQPQSPRREPLPPFMAGIDIDLGFVVAYGHILPPSILQLPRLGCVNAHASLLPRWRGASPIAAAIAAGDRETGVCLMQMDQGMDTGAVLATVRTPIDSSETTGALSSRLAELGASLLQRSLPALLAQQLVPVPQETSPPSVARKLRKEDGEIDWSAPARRVDAQARAMTPWPGAFAYVDGQRWMIRRSHVAAEDVHSTPPGTIVDGRDVGLLVACGVGFLALDEVQRDGKRTMNAAEFLQGHRHCIGRRFAAHPRH